MVGMTLLSSSSSSSSSPLISTCPKLILLTPFFPSSNPKIPTCQFHQNNKTRGIKNPRSRTTIPRAKLSGLGQVEEQLEEAFFGIDEDIEEEYDSEEDEETESSLDLFFRFMQSLFNKLSKKAKKATRSILPPLIPPQLVSFAVDGILLLSSLSIVKALLEVVCTLGSTVFVAILLLRLIWATISHFQSTGDRFDHGGNSFGAPQPIA